MEIGPSYTIKFHMKFNYYAHDNHIMVFDLYQRLEDYTRQCNFIALNDKMVEKTSDC